MKEIDALFHLMCEAKASDLDDLTVGQTYLLPLFKPVVPSTAVTGLLPYQATVKDAGPADTTNPPGVGQNAYYNVVQFVGVKITQLDKSSDVFIQPVAVFDAEQILSERRS